MEIPADKAGNGENCAIHLSLIGECECLLLAGGRRDGQNILILTNHLTELSTPRYPTASTVLTPDILNN